MLIGAVSSGSTLFASILNSSVMLRNYFQQTTFSNAFFSWRFKSKQLKINLLMLLKEPSREKTLHTLHVMTEMHFLLQKKKLKNIMHGRVKMYVMR